MFFSILSLRYATPYQLSSFSSPAASYLLSSSSLLPPFFIHILSDKTTEQNQIKTNQIKAK
jgi:hypothetical protein